MNEDYDKYAQVLKLIEPESTLLSVRPLLGGISARVTALEILRPDGSTTQMVVRQHSAVSLRYNSKITSDEYALQGALSTAGLPVPRPYVLDYSGRIFPTPYFIMEFLEGDTNFAPVDAHALVTKLADGLASVHKVDVERFDFSYLPKQKDTYTDNLNNSPELLDESLQEGRIRAALRATWSLPERNQHCVLHMDYWPGNVLWVDDAISGILDWEDAIIGDPVADLSASRLEFLWSFGVDAMETFTNRYMAINKLDFSDLPTWDLWAALKPAHRLADWATGPQEELDMREKHKWFVEQAFSRLDGASSS